MLFVPRFCSSAGRFSTSRAAADGLVDPLTVQVEQQIPPTDRQMDYALEFEAMIPDGVCKDDGRAVRLRGEAAGTGWQLQRSAPVACG